jgi:hypothetical protein
MKKLILLILSLSLAPQLCSADHQLALKAGSLPPIDVKVTLGQLDAADKAIAGNRQARKAVVGGLGVTLAWGLAKSGAVQVVVPASRGLGTELVKYTVLASLAGGGIWIGRDMWKAYNYNRAAMGDIHEALKLLRTVGPQIKMLQASQEAIQAKQEGMEAQVKAAYDNAVAARESMEGAEKTLTDFAGGTMQEFTDRFKLLEAGLAKTHRQLGDTDDLARQTALTVMGQAIEKEPNIDEMVAMAADLEKAAGRFEIMGDHQGNQRHAAEVLVEHKKTGGWNPLSSLWKGKKKGAKE